MNKILLVLMLCLCPKLIHAQWVVTPSGELLDEKSNSNYLVVEREGSQESLYKDVLKNVYKTFISPKDVVSIVENEMISIRGYGSTTIKYALMDCSLEPLFSVNIEFKDNKIRVSASWVEVLWQGTNKVDPSTFLSKGGLKCFKKNGEISNKERYDCYNQVSNEFINNIIKEDANEW